MSSCYSHEVAGSAKNFLRPGRNERSGSHQFPMPSLSVEVGLRFVTGNQIPGTLVLITAVQPDRQCFVAAERTTGRQIE